MKLGITVLVVALIASSAMGYSYLWNGSVSSNWIVAGNWTPLDGGTTFPTGAGNTAVFLSDASVVTTGLAALPSLNITGTLSVTHTATVLQSPNGTTIDGTGTFKLLGGTMKSNQGGAANTIAGGFIIQGGKIQVSGGDQIIVNSLTMSGGTMQMLAGDRIADTCPLIFNSGGAGMINWGGGDQTETLGTVQLLNQGAMNALNANIINFADSSAVDWSSGVKLRIEYLQSNYEGPGIGQLIFGNSASGLTAAQLAKIEFAEMNDGFDDTGNYYPAQILSTGQVVPLVPEPMTLSLLLVGGIAGLIRRR